MSLVVVIPSVVVALIALTASLAAVFRVNRLKSALETSERASDAWKDERNAALARAERLAEENSENTKKILELLRRIEDLEREAQRLRERTDLTKYFERQDANHHELLDNVKNLVTSIEMLVVMLKPLTAAA